MEFGSSFNSPGRKTSRNHLSINARLGIVTRHCLSVVKAISRNTVATENRIRAGADAAMGYPRFAMLDLLKLLSGLLVGLFRSHAAREAETAFLRQQLVVLKRSAPARLRLLIPRWRRPLSNCLVSRYPRTTTVVIDPVQLPVSHDNAQRPMPPASWPPSTATNHNSSAFIGQLGWPNLQTGIAWFSARQAGQKICPQPEQRMPVLSGSNVCPHSEQHHSPDWIVNGILPNKCRLPEDLPYPIARSATTLWARSRTGSKSST